MTPLVLQFIKALNLKGRTLDVGSFDINGSVRSFFNDYTGLDMRAGKNVDIVSSSHYIPFLDGYFDNVLCLETLEHDSAFWISLQEFKRILKSGGVLVITVPSIGFHKHDYPHDYWRFTKEAIELMLDGMKTHHVYEAHTSVYGYAIKI